MYNLNQNHTTDILTLKNNNMTYEIKFKDCLSNPNSSYYKRFNGILTKLVTVKNEEDLKLIPNYDKVISINKL